MIVRAAWRSKSARGSLPPARRASARASGRAPPHRARRPRSRAAQLRSRPAPRPRVALGEPHPSLEQEWRWRPAPCCGIGPPSCNSSAAERALSMLPAAISISTCASSSGARCKSVFGGSSLDGTRRGRSSASRIEATAVATSPWASGPARDRAAGPTRHGERPATLAPRLRCLLAKPDPSELGQWPPHLASQVRT